MKLNMKEKKILYAYACPSHHNTVTRLKWLTALTVDTFVEQYMEKLLAAPQQAMRLTKRAVVQGEQSSTMMIRS